MEKGSGVGEGKSLTAEEVGAEDFLLGRIPSRRMTLRTWLGMKVKSVLSGISEQPPGEERWRERDE